MEGVLIIMNAFIKLTPNMCPFCKRTHLCVVEKEITKYSIDKYGAKEDLKHIDYDVQIVCGSCGETFEASTIGGRWCIGHDRYIAPVNNELEEYNPFEKRG